jgi:predicted transcriptional regulator
MNRLDKEILKSLMLEDLTIYALQKKVGKPYATVWRHVKKLLKEEYVFMCRGEKRKAHVLSLTPKGMVMLVFEGDISKNWASYKDIERAYEEFLDRLAKLVKKMRSKR